MQSLICVMTLTLGLQTESEARKSYFMLLGMSPHTPKWAPTLGVKKSPWTLEYLESDFKGQNSLDWRLPYTIEKILKLKCLKWVHMTPFGYLKHNLWPKEGSGVKVPIWLPIIKSQKSSWFTYVQVACHISLESSQQRL